MNNDILQEGINTLITESDSLKAAASKLGADFTTAVELIYNCKGRVVVTGMGKSGHIANKIAATLASTGTPSFFMHPAEGVHGDLGMLVKGDVVIALSYSGETDEIKKIIPVLKRLALPLISITGNIKSTLAEQSCAVLDGSVNKEACPMNLAPTSSTTLALALGDALAVALVHKRGFKPEDFALVHPSGSLGKKLLLSIEDIWHTGDELPIVIKQTPLKDLLYTMSSKKLGCAIVLDNNGFLAGIITDGDLRRGMEKNNNFDTLNIENLMNPNPKTINKNALAAQAMAMMEQNSITSLICVDSEKRPLGIIHLHDLIQAGIR